MNGYHESGFDPKLDSKRVVDIKAFKSEGWDQVPQTDPIEWQYECDGCTYHAARVGHVDGLFSVSRITYDENDEVEEAIGLATGLFTLDVFALVEQDQKAGDL